MGTNTISLLTQQPPPPPLRLHTLPRPHIPPPLQLQQQPLPQQQHIQQQHTQQQQRRRRQQHGTSLVATTVPSHTRTSTLMRCPRDCPPTTNIWFPNRSPRPPMYTSRTRRRPTLPRHSWTGCPSIRAGSTTRSTILPFRTGSQRILTRSRTSRTSTPSPSTPSTTRSTPPSTPSTASQSTVHQQQNTVHLQQNTVHLQQNTVHLQQSTVLHRQSTVLQRRSTAHHHYNATCPSLHTLFFTTLYLLLS